MLDRILYFLFRRKTGLILLGISTIFFAMAFGGCFTLSMCACWHESCAEADCSDPDAKDCARSNAQYCNRMDKDYSCKDSGCDVFDCAFGYGCEKDCNNGTIDCGGCNSTCFTDCNNDCSGSTANGCETCYYSFSNCTYEGNKTKVNTYYVKICVEVVDDSENSLFEYSYNKTIKTSDLDFENNLKQTIDLSELDEKFKEQAFCNYFENALTFTAASDEVSLDEGQYELNRSIDVVVARNGWRLSAFDSNVGIGLVTIRAKAHEKVYGNPVTITVDLSSAGGSNETFTVSSGSIPQYTAPTFVSYELNGFYTIDESGNEVAFDMTKTFSAYKYGLSGMDLKLTVYAKYEKKQYTLKVIKTTDGISGSEELVTQIYHNEYMSDVLTRLKANDGLGKETETAFFRWWAYDKDGNNRVNQSDIIRENKTIYCHYAKKVNVTLYGVNGKDDGTMTFTVGYGDEIDNQFALFTPPDHGRFKFIRWCTDNTLTTGVYHGMPITEDITLYADWDETTEFNIRLFADKNSFISGSSLDEISFDYTVGTALPDWNDIKNSVTAPDGYTFAGWKIISRNADGDITAGTDIYTEIGENTLLPDDYSLVAEFSKSVTLIVKAAEGKFADGPTSKTINVYLYDNTIITPVPVNDGYEFRGWSQNSSEPYDFVSDGEKPLKTISSARLFAIFGKKQLSLTFVCDNGTPAEQIIKVTYGDSPADIPTEPTKTGYSFAGWFDENDNQFDQSAAVTKDTVYTAKFTPEKYTVTLMVNGEEFKTVEVEYGSKINLGVPSSGYFLFWYDENNKQWTDNSGDMLEAYSTDGNVTLYAKFL